jgi:hypothetical protein
VPVIRCLVKANTVGSRGCSNTPRLIVGVKLKITNKVAGLIVVEVEKIFGRGLL